VSDQHWCRAKVSTIIQPRSIGFVPIVDDGTIKYDLDHMFEPTCFSKGAIARSVYVNVKKNDELFIQVMNLSDSKVEFKQNEQVGKLSEIELANKAFDDSISHYQELNLKKLNEAAISRKKFSQSNSKCEIKRASIETGITTKQIQDNAINNLWKRCNIGTKLSQSEKELLVEVIIKNADAFQWDKSKNVLARCNLVKHSVPTGAHDPIVSKQYPIASIAKDPLRKQIAEMIDAKVIRPSNSSWRSPILLVKKKSPDGTDKWRFCIDLKKVNAITAKDCYSLPLIHETVDTLAGCSYFSTLDVDRAFWNIEVEEKDKCKLAFVIDGKLYEFNVMPFGSMNAPSTFQRLIDTVLRGLTWKQCLVYIDDVLVYSTSFDQHLKDLDEILNRFKHSGLKLKPEKCNFAADKVNYLGFKLTALGIQISDEKLATIANIQPPDTTKLLYSFLCAMNYYRNLIPQFGKLTFNLYKMCDKKLKQCVWNKSCLDSFNNLKNALVSAPILCFPDYAKVFVIQTDASGVSIAGVLLQDHNGILKPVSFCSRKLNKTEQAYSTSERELLAIVYSILQFEMQVLGRKIVVYTDHEPLVTMRSLKKPNGRLGRLFNEVVDVKFDLRHIKGDENFLPDFLSRSNIIDTVDINNTLLEFQSSINWEEAQSIDQELTQVKEQLSSTEFNPNVLANGKRWFRELRKLYVYNNILYHDNKIVVPKAMVQEVLKQHHDSVFAGHRGPETTIDSIKSRFYWNFMPIDVKTYCSNCHACQTFNFAQAHNRAPLNSIVVTKPGQIVGLDFMGPFNPSGNGNVYIILGIDHFTKFCWAKATTTFSAEITAQFVFDEIICKFGMVTSFLTDQGVNFESKLFKHLCILLNTEKLRTTTYHPPGNGITERANKNVKPYLAKYVNESHSDWDVYLPMAISSYNNSYHSTIKMTPYEAYFGRKSVLVSDVLLNNQLPADTRIKDVAEFTLSLRQAAVKLNKILLDNTREAQARQKYNYDRFVRDGNTYKVGDFVKIKNFRHTTGSVSAFEKKFIGPYKVIRVINDLNYELFANGRKNEIVHYNRLYHYSMRNGSDVDFMQTNNDSFVNGVTNNEIFQPVLEDHNSIIANQIVDIDELLDTMHAKDLKKRVAAAAKVEEARLLRVNIEIARLETIRVTNLNKAKHIQEIIDMVVANGSLDTFQPQLAITQFPHDHMVTRAIFNENAVLQIMETIDYVVNYTLPDESDEVINTVNQRFNINNEEMTLEHFDENENVNLVEDVSSNSNVDVSSDEDFADATSIDTNFEASLIIQANNTVEAHLNEKGKECVRCPICNKWCEKLTGLRIHSYSCKG
jgi:hypothetical protein